MQMLRELGFLGSDPASPNPGQLPGSQQAEPVASDVAQTSNGASESTLKDSAETAKTAKTKAAAKSAEERYDVKDSTPACIVQGHHQFVIHQVQPAHAELNQW